MLGGVGGLLSRCTLTRGSHRTIDPLCLENPRPAGAEPTLTENVASPFQAEPRQAAVSDVCGRVINPAGERLNGVELSLTSESDSATFAVESDGVGSFSFGPVPKGDYTLHATALHYHGAVRQIRVARSSDKPCTGRIVITLGFDVCDTGVRVKGTD